MEPGVYRGSVQVSTPGLTLRGSGPGTVIAPGTGPAGTGNACAVAGHGLCVTGTADHEASDVRLADISVVGFPKNGVNGTWADGLQVRRVIARDNGQQGISLEKSVRAVFRGNEAQNNGESGIFYANSADSEGGALDTRGPSSATTGSPATGSASSCAGSATWSSRTTASPATAVVSSWSATRACPGRAR